MGMSTEDGTDPGCNRRARPRFKIEERELLAAAGSWRCREPGFQMRVKRSKAICRKLVGTHACSVPMARLRN